MGVSENSVPLNPMVNDHYPYYNWEYTLFSDKPIWRFPKKGDPKSRFHYEVTVTFWRLLALGYPYGLETPMK